MARERWRIAVAGVGDTLPEEKIREMIGPLRYDCCGQETCDCGWQWAPMYCDWCLRSPFRQYRGAVCRGGHHGGVPATMCYNCVDTGGCMALCTVCAVGK